MINEGLQKATGDWAFVVWSDYILVSESKSKLIKELENYEGESWLKYKRKTNFFGKKITDSRISAIVNLKWIDENLSSRKIYGLCTKNKTIYDYPILPSFVYKEFSSDKKDICEIYIGDELRNNDIVVDSVHIRKFDHFFL